MVGKPKSERGPKVQVGVRLDPEVIELWNEIDRQEAVGNRTRVMEWCIINGYHDLAEQTKRKGELGNDLVAKHLGRSLLTASLKPAGEGEGLPRVELEINGEPVEGLSGEVRPGARRDEFWIVLTATPTDYYPALVLTVIRDEELAEFSAMAERVGNVGWLPLADGPGDGRPGETLRKLRSGELDFYGVNASQEQDS